MYEVPPQSYDDPQYRPSLDPVRLQARVVLLEGLLREVAVKLVDVQGEKVSKNYGTNLIRRINQAGVWK
jgi:hypothetical protein